MCGVRCVLVVVGGLLFVVSAVFCGLCVVRCVW